MGFFPPLTHSCRKSHPINRTLGRYGTKIVIFTIEQKMAPEFKDAKEHCMLLLEDCTSRDYKLKDFSWCISLKEYIKT